MADAKAEDITETASDGQEEISTESGVESPSTDSTVLSEEEPAEQKADDAADAESDDADSGGEAESIGYDDLVMPEGMPIDENMLGEFKGIDGKGLANEDAQKLIDFRAKSVKDSIGEWETKFSEWRGELLSDKEIGGDKFKTETVPNVLAAAERYGDKEMLTLLQTNKMYGENPALVRMLNRVGETLRADQHARGRAAGPNDDESRLRRMYPSHYNEDGTIKKGHEGARS